MANLKKNKLNKFNIHCLKLAFEQARINLGSTLSNPSVGCVIEKNGSIISSGHTSVKGRPHAEFNALKKKINFSGANVYTTLEPCSHFGKTPPCTNILKKKGIKKLYYSIDDLDERSMNKSSKTLRKNKIKVTKNILKNEAMDFYKSYLYQHKKKYPLIDAKIAMSKDFFTINKKSKWITNEYSRKVGNYLRSTYNCLVSTSKTLNKDDALFNTRIKGLEKKSPDLVLIDRELKFKKNLKIFKIKSKRKIYFVTSTNNKKKISWLKKKKISVILLNSLKNSNDFDKLFKILFKKGYSRILIEAGLTFFNFLKRKNFLNNIFIFQSFMKLKEGGLNSINKSINLNNRLQVFLFGDKLYKIRVK